MDRFTIRDIENLCRIKAHTLRIWEQRYDFFHAKRKESLHRFYDSEDLRLLLQVAFLYHGGWKVSRIAALQRSDLQATITTALGEPTNDEQDVLSLLAAASSFDERSFRERLDAIVRQKGLEDAVMQVCFPFLQRVGNLWLTNHVIPAQEHFSSYLIQHKIIAETDRLPRTKPKFPPVLLFTPRGEHHELPLLFINYLLRFYGWEVIYLGTNYDIRELPEEIRARTQILYLHLITNLTGQLPDDYFETLCKLYPAKTIVASGGAVQDAQRSFRNLVLLKSDDSIRNFVRNGL
ncbi:MAG: MerR family transcriptional regulator [Chitinophagaceae bacterium]|nr:MAG: MerR family transcriptional regulator [Chitinophagaceae bacterium]